jgi:hypothetical protein
VMAAGAHRMLNRHPWVVQAFSSYLFYGPGKARHDDHNLAIYEAAGFTGAAADQVAAAVFTYVLGNALGSSAMASLTKRLNRKGADADRVFRDATAEATEIAMRFPRLRSRLGSPQTDYTAAPERSFDVGLQAMLDGFEQKLQQRATGGPPPGNET